MKYIQFCRFIIPNSSFSLRSGGPGWIRTSEGLRQRSYSPPHLATLEPTLIVDWSRRSDSNRQPTVYKTVALPIELRRRYKITVSRRQMEI